MAAMVKFILLDSGRPVFMNPLYVEQVRDGAEPGTTVVYFTGRSGPVGLSAKLETVMRELAGAQAAPKMVSAEPAAASAKPAPVKPATAKVVAMAPKAKHGAR